LARASRGRDRLDSKHPLVRRVERALALAASPRIVVAVSGGADSVFLLRALQALSPARGFEVEVAHFNHRWRGAESDADAAFVEALAKALGVQLHLGVALRTRAQRSSPEAAARADRYRFLARVARARGADVATGHTLDDQLETYLLGWLRGSGPAGASLMPAIGPLPVQRSTVRLLRPLLTLGREEIRVALRAAEQPWREDRTNQDPQFLRSRVRHELVPLLEALAPGARKTILRSAALAREAADFLERRAEDAAGRLFVRVGDALAADRESLLELDPALLAPALLSAVERLFESVEDVESAHLESAVGLVRRGTGGKRTPLGPLAELRLTSGRVLIAARGQPE
jgi:tRNA(Ile)-lysidine synthase